MRFTVNRLRGKGRLILFACVIAILGLTACAHMPETGMSPSKKREAFLGIGYRIVTDSDPLRSLGIPRGLTVSRIVSGSAAEKAGLRAGDIIIAWDSVKAANEPPDLLARAFGDCIKNRKAPGDPLTLTVVRTETVLEGRSDGTARIFTDSKELKQSIDSLKPDERLDVAVTKRVAVTDITVILGERSAAAYTPSAEDERRCDRLRALMDERAELAANLIARCGAEAAYQDILQRYSDDESSADAFRLPLMRCLHLNPLTLPAAAEDLTSRLNEPGTEGDMSRLTEEFSEVLGIPTDDAPRYPPFPGSARFEDHLAFITAITGAALEYRKKAFSSLSDDELLFIAEHLPGEVEEGFADDDDDDNPDGAEARAAMRERLLALLGKIDYSALARSAEVMAHLSERKWLSFFRKSLRELRAAPSPLEGVQGDILYTGETPTGLMVIGGAGPNRYSRTIAVLIDAGGDDLYLAGAGSALPGSPLSCLIDFEGNDEYSSADDFVQGAGFLGVGILIDVLGNDTYQGVRYAQGAGLAGAGILVDYGGDDSYTGEHYNQGIGFWGIGILADYDGSDNYRSHVIAQGAGGPGGAGLLYDGKGNDSYFATGHDPGSYGTPGTFDGFSQGFGIGFRDVAASGGIGILMDTGGNDRMRAGNFSQGGGYYFGIGILRNAGDGNDIYYGSRYAQGFCAHSAAGILIDDGGDDVYGGMEGALQAAAWDLGVASLIDKAGNDRYESMGLFFSRGAAAHNGLSLFIDMAGEDRYDFPYEPRVPGNNYHGGSSLAIFVDAGGSTDLYNGDTAENNHITCEEGFAITADLEGGMKEALETD